MEKRTLISMVDYVLLVAKETPTLDTEQYDWFCIEQSKLESVRDYANFLRQSLELWQFVPVGENGEVLEEPEMYGWLQNVGSMNSHATEEECVRCEIYHKAKSRCIFEGFEVFGHPMNPIDKKFFSEAIALKGIINIFWRNNETGQWSDWRLSHGIRTIEDLIPYNLTLTENALK